MSTLSEIAANHAKAAKPLDAESAISKVPCSLPSNDCRDSNDEHDQVAPYAIAALTERRVTALFSVAVNTD
ncbi:hypothetical protein AUC61_14000 [Pseudomonas sp. S25]|uniref:Uncharacterized protein n=1 Tax=Pseudomonas maioricensis TaxID=1766623 RepID=A0ABS9ZKL4_9PSED|nr:hypothetical protein [Pseudomonas sp. S25]